MRPYIAKPLLPAIYHPKVTLFQIIKSGLLTREGYAHNSGGIGSLLGYDYFSNPLIWGLFVVNLIMVDGNYSPNSKVAGAAISSLNELILAVLLSCHPLVGGAFFLVSSYYLLPALLRKAAP